MKRKLALAFTALAALLALSGAVAASVGVAAYSAASPAGWQIR
jgi:hypothetical protein